MTLEETMEHGEHKERRQGGAGRNWNGSSFYRGNHVIPALAATISGFGLRGIDSGPFTAFC
jgi:hypothetical protein